MPWATTFKTEKKPAPRCQTVATTARLNVHQLNHPIYSCKYLEGHKNLTNIFDKARESINCQRKQNLVKPMVQIT